MVTQIAADITVLLHLLWIVFLIFGALIGRRYLWVKIIHIGGMGLAVALQMLGWYCPLTYLEFWLRRAHGPEGDHPGSFIIYYVEKLVYVDLSPKIIFAATIVLVFVSMLIYLWRPGKEEGMKPD